MTLIDVVVFLALCTWGVMLYEWVDKIYEVRGWKKLKEEERQIMEEIKGEEAIASALRDYGATVKLLSAPGLPDLLVGYGGLNILMVVKTGDTKLSDRQERFHADWNGQIEVVRNISDALKALNLHAYKYKRVGIISEKDL